MTGGEPTLEELGRPSFSGLFQRGMVGALIRYRVMAFVVGTALLCLFVVVIFQVCGVKMKVEEEIVAPIHGYLYLVYLVTAADLARRARWRLGRILVVAAAGFVPTLAFFVEHHIYRQMQAEWAADGLPDHTGARTATSEPPDPVRSAGTP